MNFENPQQSNAEGDSKKREKSNTEEVAKKLIESGLSNYLVENLYQFPGIYHRKIALQLMLSQKYELLVENLNKFEGLNHERVALKLIEMGKSSCVVQNIDKFPGLSSRTRKLLLR